MATLLHIDCSPQRNTRSISRQITSAGTAAWRRQNPQGQVLYRDLTRTPLVPLGQEWIDGKNLKDSLQTEEQGFALSQSDDLVRELMSADVLLIGTPMHNFNVPAVLKWWLDLVIRQDRTIRFTTTGTQGLLRAKIAIVVIASGGDYSEGSTTQYLDFETPYLTFVLRALGIKDVRFVHAFRTAQVADGHISSESFLQPLSDLLIRMLVEDPHTDVVCSTVQEEVLCQTEA